MLDCQAKRKILIWLHFVQNFNGKTIWQFYFSRCFFSFYWCSRIIRFFCHLDDTLVCFPLAFQMDCARILQKYCIVGIIEAVELRGHAFQDRWLLVSTDNKVVVYAINCLSSKSPPVNKMLRYLFFKCLSLNIWI